MKVVRLTPKIPTYVMLGNLSLAKQISNIQYLNTRSHASDLRYLTRRISVPDAPPPQITVVGVDGRLVYESLVMPDSQVCWVVQWAQLGQSKSTV